MNFYILGEKSIQPNVALLKLPNKQNVVCASSDSDKDDDSYIGEDYSKSSYESGDSGRNKKASADSYGRLFSVPIPRLFSLLSLYNGNIFLTAKILKF